VTAFVQPKIDFVFNHIKDVGLILDVGCGNGYFTYYLEKVGPTIGLDYAATMLSQNPVEALVQGSAFELPFADDSFDLVLCSNLLHHLLHPLKVISEMKRTSKKYVVLHEPNRNNPAMLALALFKAEERGGLRFTSSYLGSLAHQAGLYVIACQTLGFVTPNRMPKAIAKILARFNKPSPFAAYSILVAECRS
jgi:SAM-dependent methyltransferase